MEKLKMAEGDYAQLARVLRQVDFFAPMTIGQLEMILPYILLYRYQAGETVFKQGEQGDAFYIVRDGKVAVRIKKGFLSFSKQVAEIGEGGFFGEMALLSNEPRTATVACTADTRLFVLTSTDFQYVLKKNPSFADEIQKIAERRKFQSKREG